MKSKTNFLSSFLLITSLFFPISLLAYDFDQSDAGDTLIIQKGTYNFEYDGINQDTISDWFFNGIYQETDEAGYFAIDPDIDVNFLDDGEYTLEIASEYNHGWQNAIWYPTIVPSGHTYIHVSQVTSTTAQISLQSSTLLIGDYTFELNYKQADSSSWSPDIIIQGESTLTHSNRNLSYFSFTNLLVGKTYDLRVKICNRGGCNAYDYNQFTTLPDTILPTNPTSFETTPLEGVLTDDINILISWSGASDNIGLSGYYFLFDNNTDTQINAANATFVNDTTGSSSLSYGFYKDIFYFHLRYIDENDKLASDTVHLGPFILGGASQGVNSAIIMYLLN